MCLYVYKFYIDVIFIFLSVQQMNPVKIPSVWTGQGQNCPIFTAWTGKSIDGEAPLFYASNQIFTILHQRLKWLRTWKLYQARSNTIFSVNKVEDFVLKLRWINYLN